MNHFLIVTAPNGEVIKYSFVDRSEISIQPGAQFAIVDFFGKPEEVDLEANNGDLEVILSNGNQITLKNYFLESAESLHSAVNVSTGKEEESGPDEMDFRPSQGIGNTPTAGFSLMRFSDLRSSRFQQANLEENSLPSAQSGGGASQISANEILNNSDSGPSFNLQAGASNNDLGNGTLGSNSDGSFAYTPNANYNGPNTSTTNNGATDTATSSVNDPPVANPDTDTTDEDTPVNVDPLANDTDADGDPLNICGIEVGGVMVTPTPGVPITLDSGATVTLLADGTIDYDSNGVHNSLDAGESATDIFTYKIDDGNGGTSTSTFTVTVNGVEDPTITNPDAESGAEDTPISGDVLLNDSDPDASDNPLTVVSNTNPTNGTVVVNPDGTYTYTPNANFTGTDTFTYTTSTGATDTVTITVNPVNDPPTANPDTGSTDEDTPVNVDPLANDTDPDGDPLNICGIEVGGVMVTPTPGVPITLDSGATVTLLADGTIDYDSNGIHNSLDAGESATDIFTYKIDDGNGGTSTSTFTVTVNGVEDPTVTNPDTGSTNEDTPLIGGSVLGNDSDPDASDNPLTVVSNTPTSNGTVVVNPDGTYTYTPNANFTGTDTFTYTTSTGATDTVTITVNPVNDPPTANPDTGSTDEDTPVNVDPLANDTDPDGDPLNICGIEVGGVMVTPTPGVPITLDSGATVTLLADGTIDYDSNGIHNSLDAGESATDIFTYKIDDGNGGTSTSTFTVTVNGVEDPTVTNPDTGSTNEDTPLIGGSVLGNDSDPDASDNPLTVVSNTPTSNGTVVVNPDGTYTYTPNANFTGTDTLTYTTSTGATDTVTITVNPVNDGPVAVDDTAGTMENATVVVSVLSNDVDLDGDTLTVTATTDGANGSVAIDGATGEPVYSPNTGFTGTDTFSYTISDGSGGTDTATVNVSVGNVNDAPDAINDTISISEDTSVTIPVRGNDSDLDGDALTVTAATNATNGTVSIDGVTGDPIYTPNANFSGTDTFSYTISDGNGGTDSATVTVNVAPVNDVPDAINDTASTNEDASITIPVRSNDTDLDGDALTVVTTTNGTNGTVSIDGATSDPIYTPNPNFNGTDTFSYTISDGNGGTDTATVTVNVLNSNDTPNAVNDIVSGTEDTALTLTNVDLIDPNDTDLDGDALTITAVANPTNGTVSLEGGDVVFTPLANYNGAAAFDYTISDGNGGTDTATVTVNVTPLNDNPDAIDDTAATSEDASITIPVRSNDTDLDGDALTVVTTTNGTNGTVSIDGVTGDPIYTPNANFNGTDTFSYTISDGNGGTDTATVTVNVSNTNDAPSAVDDIAFGTEDTALTLTNVDLIDPNDTDLDGDTLTITSVANPTNGTVSLEGGDVVFTPLANYNGAAAFDYTISDGNGGTDTATVTVNVTPLNDNPDAIDDTAATSEDASITIPVRSNDTDLDGDALTVTATTNGTNGTVSIDVVTGDPIYTPDANFSGTDTFSYTISDGNGGTDTANVTVSVTAVNDDPDAIDDTATTNEGTSITIPVLGNDTDPEGDSLTVTAAGSGSNGTVFIDSITGNPIYTPNSGFTGTDTFVYEVSDGNGGTDVATVTVNVTTSMGAPNAVDDNYILSEDSSLTTTLLNGILSNDSDPEGDSITLNTTPVSDVSNGTLTLTGFGTFTYTPDANYAGTDTFTYEISDGNGNTSTATVTLFVNGSDDPPVAVDDIISTDENISITIPVRGNDTDLDGDALTVTATTNGTNGTVTIDGVTGDPIYTPNASFNGTDTFSYTISDGNGGTDVATVMVNVAPLNDNPDAINDTISTNEDASVTIPVRGNDTDLDGDALTVVNATNGINGSVSIDGVTGDPIYTPNANFNGIDTFSYTISDGNGGTDIATVTVNVAPSNDTPNAVDDTIGAIEDTPITLGNIDIIGPNDTDLDGDTLTITSVANPANGTVSLVGGDVVFAPDANYNGPATFDYTISDGNGGSDTATVTLNIGAVNDDPDAINDTISTNEDTSVTIPVRSNDADLDGDTLTVVATTNGTNGTVSIDGVTGDPIYTPDPNFNGTDTFSYTISDGNGGTDVATVMVNVTAVNDVPDAIDDSASTAENTSLTVPVLGNDTDTDGDSLTITGTTDGINGTVVIDGGSGNPIYTPTLGFTGTDTFSYTISDGNGGTDTATVTVNVSNTNDAPNAVDDIVSGTEDTVLTLTNADLIDPNDTDLDGDTLTITSVANPANGTVSLVGGDVVFTPTADYNGSAAFDYTISDGNGGTDIATVTVNVASVNDDPDAINDTTSTNEDASITIPVRGNDTDLDGDALTVTATTNGANGTVAIDGVTGDPVYMPNANFSGTDTFSYTISDGNGGTDTATVTVNVNPVNDGPVAVDDTAATMENATVVVSVLSNDVDLDGDTLTVTATTDGANGSVAIDGVSGEPVYSPNTGFTGTDTFSYTISDGNGGTDTAIVNVSVGNVNDAPDGIDDIVSTNEDTAITIPVRGNDTDLDSDALTVVATTNGTSGTVVIDGVTGDPVYTPNANFNGTDSFTYTISDGNGGTDTATVTVNVAAVNDAPNAADDTIGAAEDTPITLGSAELIGPNDTDLDGDTLTITSVANPANGSVSLVGGDVVFAPDANYNGPATFDYTISDGNGGSDTATVTLNIGTVNDNPDAITDTISTNEDTSVTIPVRSNDTDLDGDTLTVVATTNGTNGTVSIDGVTGDPIYTPDPNFNGTDTFSYTISDGNGGTDVATVMVNVVSVNDNPDAINYTTSTNEDASITIPVRGNDTDLDGDALTVVATTNGTNGTVSIDGVTGDPIYTPNANFDGADTFSYTISDGNGGTDTATVSVNVVSVNDNPDAINDTISTNEDASIAIPVRGNDTDLDGDALTVTATTNGVNGTVTIDGVTGDPIYTPDPNFNGTDTFSYTISDGNGGTDVATVTVTVTAVNDAPDAIDDSASTAENTSLTVPVLGNDTDIDGDSLTITGTTDGINGTVAIDGVSGNPIYTPTLGFTGTDTFSYTISDGNGGTDTATVTVNVSNTNDAPYAVDDIVSGTEDTALTLTNADLIDPNDTDLDGDTLTITSTGNPSNGTVSLVGGDVVFTPDVNYNGPATFDYTISDGNGGTDTATVTVNVASVNDNPDGINDTISTNEDTSITIPVRVNDTDLDGDALTITAATNGTNGSVSIDGVTGDPIYTPNANFNGTDTFSYTISDGNGGTDTATVTVNVAAVNDAPEATNDIVSTAEDTSIMIPVRGNDTDLDGDALTVTAATNGINGTVSVDGVTGDPVYTPNANFNGTDTFSYTISDGNGGTDTATVTVNVSNTNDAPYAVDDIVSGTEDTVLTLTNADLIDPNDTDLDGDALTFTAVANPTNGTVSLVGGDVVFSPDANYNGPATFDYTISDGTGGTDAATVTVNVTPVNDNPDAIDDTASTNEDASITIPVRSNDTDLDGDALTVTATTNGTNGTVTIDVVTGDPIYTPNANFDGTDTFTYTISDGNGGTDTATVTVNVAAVNDAPNAVDDTIGATEDTPITLGNIDIIDPNDTDLDGDTLTITSVANPANGTVSLVGGDVVFAPDANYNGPATFDYTISDGNGGSDTATVTLNIGTVNDNPDAINDTISTNEDASITIPVRGNDTDLDGDALTVVATTNGTNGTVSIDGATGDPIYTPNANFNGTDTFSYTISDGNGGTDTAAVTVNVASVNDNPDAINDTISTNEDASITIPVRGNDTDLDGDALTVVATTNGTNGTVSIDGATGDPIYTPNANFDGTDTFSYTISDGNGGTDIANVTVDVASVNDAPDAINDTISTNEDTSVTIPVRGNDSDLDGDALTVTAATNGTNGTVSIDGVTGDPIYTPNANFNGTDTFSYTISDGSGGTDSATVTVNVASVNDNPDAINDTISTNEDASITIPVRSNDTDLDGDALTVVTTTNGTNGTVSIDGATSDPIYTPNPNFNGTDTFSYTISDGNGGTDTATVTVNVLNSNDAPNAVNDIVSGTEDTALTLTNVDLIDPNDTDLDGDALTITAVANPTNGTVSLEGGDVVFTPLANYNGAAAFDYTISDGNGGTDTATVTVNVTPLNDNPDAIDDTAATSEDASITIPVRSNDTDLDGDALTVTATTNGTNGTVSIDVVTGDPIYTPDANFSGTDTFSYTISDGNGGTDTANVTVSVTAVNDDPDAIADTATTNEGTSITIPVLGNDTDPEGDSLTVTAAGSGSNGTVFIDSITGNPIYTPNSGFTGTDTFVYEVSDGNGGTDVATVTVNVTTSMGAPNAVDDNYILSEDSSLTTTLLNGILSNDSDPEGDSITLNTTPVSDVSNGTLTLTGFGTFTYTPDANYAGTDTFTYEISDGNGNTSTATVTLFVNGSDDPPVAVDDAYTTDLDTAYSSTLVDGLLANDSDPDGDPLILNTTPLSGPANGTIAINADGTFTYTPNSGFTGTDSFVYELSDGMSTSSATATIAVGPPPPSSATPTLDLDSNAGSPTEQIQDGTFGNRWDTAGFWTITGQISGAQAPLHNDNSLNGSIIQSNVSGWDSGDLTFDYRFFEDGDSSTMEVRVGGVTYAIFDTDTQTAVGVNGAVLTSSDSTLGFAHASWETFTLQFPSGMPSTADLEFAFVTTGVTSPLDDQALDNISLIASVDASPGNDYSTSFTEGNGAVSIAGAVSIEDADDTNMESASVTLTNAQTADDLLVGGSSAASGTLASGISWVKATSGGQIVVSFSGNASISDYEAAIQGVAFENTSTSPSTVDRNIVVSVHDGDTSSLAATTTISVNAVPPIVIDLDGDGAEFSSIEEGILQDVDGDGELEQTAWASKDDAVLIYDANDNNEVDGRSEFAFADYSDDPNATDLEGLRAGFDSNEDGVLDANDEEFSSFKIWQDANGNGLVDDGEMISLSEAGIESIELTSDGESYEAAGGDVTVHGEATVHYSDGSTGIAADATFNFEEIVEEDEVPLEITTESGDPFSLEDEDSAIGTANADLLTDCAECESGATTDEASGTPNGSILSAEDEAAASGAGLL